MKDFKIKSLSDFNEIVQKHCHFASLFRGHSSTEYKLVPSVSRLPKITAEELIKAERNMLRIFRTSAYSVLKSYEISEIELLAIAQHHGMKTRLLDWTRSALVALFFACEKNTDTDGVVYILPTSKISFLVGPEAKEIKPFALEEDIFYLPYSSTNRIPSQGGLFLVFKEPLKEFSADELISVIVPKDIKGEIIRNLQLLGITKAVLFPDLDGLASYINYNFDYGY